MSACGWCITGHHEACGAILRGLKCGCPCTFARVKESGENGKEMARAVRQHPRAVADSRSLEKST